MESIVNVTGLVSFRRLQRPIRKIQFLMTLEDVNRTTTVTMCLPNKLSSHVYDSRIVRNETIAHKCGVRDIDAKPKYATI